MLAAVVPHAADVGHEPLEAAKPLLLLGWSAPAALTARVALEQTLQAVAMAAGVDLEAERLTAGGLIVALETRRTLDSYVAHRAMRATVRLSAVAHGSPVTLHRAVELIEAAERSIAELRQVK